MRKNVTLAELSDFTKEFLQAVKPSEEATVIGFYGNLGAGKTTFIKEIARQLGVEEEVASPTFTLLKQYKTKNSKFEEISHIDLYRIEDVEEIKILDLDELFKKEKTLVLIEWANKMNDILDRNIIEVHITNLKEDSREFVVQNV